MELELGLKISKTLDDFTSSTDLRIAKDRSGPIFVSRETDSMFILTAHLKGYKREFIKIEINQDGTRISVRGEKPVQEMVMVGWKMYKKETEIKGFIKAFKIPDGVILDKIKARFDEEESILTISMPKSAKGVFGISVEEVKDDNPSVEKLPSASEKAEQEQTTTKENQEPTRMEDKHYQDQDVEEKQEIDKREEDHEHNRGTMESTKIAPNQVIQRLVKKDQPKGEKSDRGLDQIETSSTKRVIERDREVEGKEEVRERENAFEEEDGEESGLVKGPEEEVQSSEPIGTEKEKRSKICAPLIAGSAFLVSIIVLVITLIRTKNPPARKTN